MRSTPKHLGKERGKSKRSVKTSVYVEYMVNMKLADVRNFKALNVNAWGK